MVIVEGMLRCLVGVLDGQITQSVSQERSGSSRSVGETLPNTHVSSQTISTNAGNQSIGTLSTTNTVAINKHRRLFSRQSVSIDHCKMNNFKLVRTSMSRRLKDFNIHTCIQFFAIQYSILLEHKVEKTS